MATIINSQLTTGFMSGLTNSAHDEFVNAVYNYLTATDSPAAALPESEPYSKALADFKATKESEHKAFMLTKKDYASEDLKKANKTVTSLMTALRYALRGFALVPTDDANKRKAQELYQTIVTAKYRSADRYKQKNAKISGVLTELNKAKDTLKTFGMDVVATQLETANNAFASYISNRRAWKTAYRTTEKMESARKESEKTLQALFDVIVSRATIEPQIELTQIVNWLSSTISDTKQKNKNKKDNNTDKKGTSSSDGKTVTKTDTTPATDGKDATDENTTSATDGKGATDKNTTPATDGEGTTDKNTTPATDGKGATDKNTTSATDGKGATD